MSTIRFIMVGGFLGAGKTTTIGRLARHYAGQGKKVGVITNDQAQDLVDTHSLRQQGFQVQEVAGACFCCKFDDLLNQVGTLEADGRPDVILAEPVGSCTDLVATVIQPIKHLYQAKLSVAPYAVLFKPSHGLKILRNEEGAGFSAKAAYIFRKQLEEADAILINRIDELPRAQADELAHLLGEGYPGTPVLRVSAKTGQGFEGVTQTLEMEGRFGHKILEIDYDAYAEGEAELGWLNSSLRLKADRPLSLDAFLLDVVAGLQRSLQDAGAEAAHLKVIGLADGSFGVANLVNSLGKPELSAPSNATTSDAEIIVNARVAIDPAVLSKCVAEVVAEVGRRHRAISTHVSTQSFRPGRPTPTHRYAVAT